MNTFQSRKLIARRRANRPQVLWRGRQFHGKKLRSSIYFCYNTASVEEWILIRKKKSHLNIRRGFAAKPLPNFFSISGRKEPKEQRAPRPEDSEKNKMKFLANTSSLYGPQLFWNIVLTEFFLRPQLILRPELIPLNQCSL